MSLYDIIDAATRGSWELWTDSQRRHYVTANNIAVAQIVTNGGVSYDAEFIATFDPPTVRALLDLLDAYRELADCLRPSDTLAIDQAAAMTRRARQNAAWIRVAELERGADR